VRRVVGEDDAVVIGLIVFHQSTARTALILLASSANKTGLFSNTSCRLTPLPLIAAPLG